MSRPDPLGDRMKDAERWASAVVPDGVWIIVRVDGRGFSGLTEVRYRKPFDQNFHSRMLATTGELVRDLEPAVAAFTQSDEISVILHPGSTLFARRPEKLSSVAAGIASANFTVEQSYPAVFDGRCLTLPTVEDVNDYLRWRIEDARRNAVSSAAYWLLRSQGESARTATNHLKRLGTAGKRKLLEVFDAQYLPVWAETGTIVFWETVPHEGHNPVTGETVPTTRRRLASRYVTDIGGEGVRSILHGALP